MLDDHEVHAILGDDLESALVACHLGAATRLKEIATEYPAAIAALNATERANFLHGQIRDLVAVAVEPMEGVRVTPWNVDTIAVGVNLLVRFKYLGNGAPANNKSTEQQQLLDSQQYTEETMELLAAIGVTEPPTLVTCGYTLDGLDMSSVRIQRDCKGHDTWHYPIHGELAPAVQLRFPGTEEARPAVVTSKKKKKAQDEAGEG